MTNDPVCAALSHRKQDLSTLCAAVLQERKNVWRVWKPLQFKQEESQLFQQPKEEDISQYSLKRVQSLLQALLLARG